MAIFGGCLVSKSVQVLFNGIKAGMLLTFQTMSPVICGILLFGLTHSRTWRILLPKSPLRSQCCEDSMVASGSIGVRRLCCCRGPNNSIASTMVPCSKHL